MAKYSRGAGKKVETAMHEMKEGKLKSGRSGKKVTNSKQAIAIGLSEARERGEKVPAKKASSKRSSSKTASKASGRTKTASKTARKGTTKTASKAGRKTAAKKTASKSKK